jgi:hypothetical protein
MSRAEMILKVVMSPPDPPSVFVEHYIRLVPGNLQLILYRYPVFWIRIRMDPYSECGSGSRKSKKSLNEEKNSTGGLKRA